MHVNSCTIPGRICGMHNIYSFSTYVFPLKLSPPIFYLSTFIYHLGVVFSNSQDVTDLRRSLNNIIKYHFI